MATETDELYPLTALPDRSFMPKKNGAKISVPTLWRWANIGVGGVKLETAKVGGARCTTDAWAKAFIEALSAPKGKAESRTPARHRREVERAKAALAREGI